MAVHGKCYITTSWDDGSPFDLRLAELLARYGLQGTFYVPLQPAAPVLGESEIRHLASQFEVGAHTVRHVPLTEMSHEEAEREMTVSRAEIERITGRACPMFCFPSGRHTRAHLRLARRAGFQACRTVAMLSLDPPAGTNGVLVMPTSVQAYAHSAETLARNLIKRGAARPAWNWLRCWLTTDWLALAEALLAQALEAGGVFHLWGHSEEVARFGQWRRLEDLFRRLADCAASAPCLSNSQVCRRTSAAACAAQPAAVSYP